MKNVLFLFPTAFETREDSEALKLVQEWHVRKIKTRQIDNFFEVG